MQLVTTVAEARTATRTLRSAPNSTLGLVPTMGALHEGHLSLVRAARRTCDHVAVSIFVNPTQFGPTEDLDRYPRTLEADCALLRQEGVHLVFAPTAGEMYPSGTLTTSVDPGDLGKRLDGRSRPGHFRGVATVVSKLLGILEPTIAFFGQKDAAQIAVLRAMLGDLNFPVQMVVCPTVREPDGLALSSRNRFLTAEQHGHALALSQALLCADREVRSGVRNCAVLIDRMRHHLSSPYLRIDYIEAVHNRTLLPQQHADEHTLLAVAAWLGDTRLIDNLPLRDLFGGGQP